MVRNLPAMQETWVQSLGQEDPLEKRTATHSSRSAWRIPWTEESGRLQGVTKSWRWLSDFHFPFFFFPFHPMVPRLHNSIGTLMSKFV